MGESLALLRASWMTATSYRLAMILSVVGLAATIVPVYFVSSALQPMMAERIATEGRQYFSFVLIGMIVLSFVGASISTPASAVGSGIATGTLEALLATRASLPAVLTGLVSYSFIWTALRSALLLSIGAVLGANLVPAGWFAALLIFALILLAHIPIGLIAAALVLAFRTAGPLPQGVMILSGLLGGVYYPTHVIPSWIQRVSDFIPLSYGLRALRRTLLDGAPFSAVASDVAILALFAAALGAAGVTAFSLALRYARRAGTLAQY